MLDWDDLRFFLAVARHGSLTAAARDLGVAQSTVGRRLASLEAGLGARLLARRPDGYALTAAGEGVRVQAERVEAEALAVERAVGGHDAGLAGTVRVTCSEALAAHLLAPCFAALQDEDPGVLVELVPDLGEESLTLREADVAVRLDRPERHDLVTRRVGRLAYGLYAAPAYLERRGDPDFAEGCAGHRVLTLLDGAGDDAQTRWLGALATRARVAFRTSSPEALLAAARAGGGLACLLRFRADSDPGLRRIGTPATAPGAEVSLVVHEDARALPRNRLVLAAIAEAVRSAAAMLDPSDGAGAS